MKLLLLIALGLLIYNLFRKDKEKNTKGHVSYQSPDEFHRRDIHEKDVTDRARIVPEREKNDR